MTHCYWQYCEEKHTIIKNVLYEFFIENDMTFYHCQLQMIGRYNQYDFQDIESVKMVVIYYFRFQNHYQYHDPYPVHYHNKRSKSETKNISPNDDNASIYIISKDLK